LPQLSHGGGALWAGSLVALARGEGQLLAAIPALHRPEPALLGVAQLPHLAAPFAALELRLRLWFLHTIALGRSGHMGLAWRGAPAAELVMSERGQ